MNTARYGTKETEITKTKSWTVSTDRKQLMTFLTNFSVSKTELSLPRVWRGCLRAKRRNRHTRNDKRKMVESLWDFESGRSVKIKCLINYNHYIFVTMLLHL